MSQYNIPIEESNQVSPLIKAYLSNQDEILPFFEYKNTIEGFQKKIEATKFSKKRDSYWFSKLRNSTITMV